MIFTLTRIALRSLISRIILAMWLTIVSGLGYCQISSPSPATESMQTILLKADTIDKAFALFTPALNKAQILKSDYLLLDSPAIAPAGTIAVHLMSELPGTDFFILLKSKPEPGETVFLAEQHIPSMGKADVRLKIKLTKNSELMLLVRAGGKWYSVTNDVKIAVK